MVGFSESFEVLDFDFFEWAGVELEVRDRAEGVVEKAEREPPAWKKEVLDMFGWAVVELFRVVILLRQVGVARKFERGELDDS